MKHSITLFQLIQQAKSLKVSKLPAKFVKTNSPPSWLWNI